MKELNLRKGKMPFPPAPVLSMDDYLKFTEWNFKNAVQPNFFKERFKIKVKRIPFHL